MEKRYSADWIYSIETKLRWDLYWMQQSMIQNYTRRDESILEIGHGSGFLSNYLKTRGYCIKTLDIDPEKKPDIVADIVNYKFKQKYDNILAFEVLEHLEYSSFEKVLKKLRTVCNNYLIISLPINVYQILRLIIFFLNWKFDFSIHLPKNRITSKYHRWEYRYKNFSRKNILNSFENSNFNLVTSKRLGKHIFLVFN